MPRMMLAMWIHIRVLLRSCLLLDRDRVVSTLRRTPGSTTIRSLRQDPATLELGLAHPRPALAVHQALRHIPVHTYQVLWRTSAHPRWLTTHPHCQGSTTPHRSIKWNLDRSQFTEGCGAQPHHQRRSRFIYERSGVRAR